MTQALLDSGLCSVSQLHDGSFPDSHTCWHGSRVFDNCNIVYDPEKVVFIHKTFLPFFQFCSFQLCLWWHFSRGDGEKEMEKKYQEIIHSEHISRLSSNYDYVPPCENSLTDRLVRIGLESLISMLFVLFLLLLYLRITS